MKTKILLFGLLFPFFTSMGQTVEGVFKNTFPEYFGDLKIDSTTQYDKSKLQAYRDLYYKLGKGYEDVKAFEIGAATEDIMQVFDYKTVKKLEKNNKLDSLKMMIKTAQNNIQNFLKWNDPLGADTLTAIQHFVAYRDLVRAKKYIQAYPQWRFLFFNYPLMTRTLYDVGPIILHHKIKKAKSPKKAAAYADTLMMVYQQALKVLPKLYNSKQLPYKRAYYLGKYAVDKYLYYIKGKDLNNDTIRNYMKEVYNLASEAIDLGKEKTPYYVFPVAMKMAFFLYKLKQITGDEALNDYMKYSDYLQAQYEATKNPKKKNIIKKKGMDPVDLIFSKSDLSTCENLCSVFGKQYEQKKDDPHFLKKILTILSSKDCTDSLLFEKAAVQLYKLEPSADAAASLATLFAKKENYQEAEKYYLEAIKLDSVDTVKANYYFQIAKIQRKLGNYSKAREYALQAAKLNPHFGDPYILIAMMYAATASNCGKDQFAHKAVYWAAVDKLIKAKEVDPRVASKANSLIVRYSAMFPDKNDGFMHGVYEGNKYKIEGCWINETTIARYKK